MIDFSGCNLKDVNFHKVDFVNPINLTVEQLSEAATLYQATGIPPEIEKELRETHPHLFEKPE